MGGGDRDSVPMLIAGGSQIARVIENCNQHFFVGVAWHARERIIEGRKGAKTGKWGRARRRWKRNPVGVGRS